MHNNSDDTKIGRRSFLQAAGVVAGSAIASTALSYDRILGANDRIALGHIGIGNRGSELHTMISKLKDKYNVETVAVCDLWKNNRDRAVTRTTGYYGRAPQAILHPEELLALKNVDAVVIATPEHSHSPMLKAAAEAGKDAYCEKPMGNVLEEVKAARDAVKQRNLVVQIGTQHRSEPYQLAAREVAADRRPRRREQVRDRVELQRSAVARPAGGEADSGTGHRLEDVAHDQAVPAL